MKKAILTAAAAAALSVGAVQAQQTYEELVLLTVNPTVTTVVTASEPVSMVDVSTDNIIADMPLDNVVRLKPVSSDYADGELLAVATIITERYRAQYGLVYTTRPEEAVTDKVVEPEERVPFNNPSVTLSTEEMIRFSRLLLTSPATYRGVSTRMHRMKMRLNNVYTYGDYFFIDFSVENSTNLKFDIDQLRVKLSDRKIAKSTNAQTIELVPELVLDERESFKRGYRNVIVIRKMTFPNAKVLTLELTERQISGRNIHMDLEYTDILSADSFDSILLKEH